MVAHHPLVPDSDEHIIDKAQEFLGPACGKANAKKAIWSFQNSSASCIAVQEFLGPARGLRPGGASAPPPPSHMGSIPPQRDASPPRYELRA